MSLPVSRDAGQIVPARHRVRSHLWFLITESVLLLALLVLAVVVHAHPGPLPGDASIEVGVQRALLHRGLLTAAIEAISTVNWPVPTAITLAIIVAIFSVLRRWLDAIVPPLAAGTSSLATFLLSRWVHRPRPLGHGVHPLQYITTTYSFPSGHVTYAVAVFGLFLFLTAQVRRAVHPALRWGIRAVLVAVVLLMPLSRLTEGEHWPSDVLAGVLDGAFWLVLFAHLWLWLRTRLPGLLAHDER